MCSAYFKSKFESSKPKQDSKTKPVKKKQIPFLDLFFRFASAKTYSALPTSTAVPRSSLRVILTSMNGDKPVSTRDGRWDTAPALPNRDGTPRARRSLGLHIIEGILNKAPCRYEQTWAIIPWNRQWNSIDARKIVASIMFVFRRQRAKACPTLRI